MSCTFADNLLTTQGTGSIRLPPGRGPLSFWALEIQSIRKVAKLQNGEAGRAGRIRTPVYASTGLRIGRTAGPPRTRPAESGKVAIRTQRAVSISPCSLFWAEFWAEIWRPERLIRQLRACKGCRIYNALIARLLHTQEGHGSSPCAPTISFSIISARSIKENIKPNR